MDTAGDSLAKRVKNTYRGWRRSAGQKKRDQRNQKYYLCAYAVARLAQNYGTASCDVASTSDGGVQSIETERGVVGAGEKLVTQEKPNVRTGNGSVFGFLELFVIGGR